MEYRIYDIHNVSSFIDENLWTVQLAVGISEIEDQDELTAEAHRCVRDCTWEMQGNNPTFLKAYQLYPGLHGANWVAIVYISDN